MQHPEPHRHPTRRDWLSAATAWPLATLGGPVPRALGLLAAGTAAGTAQGNEEKPEPTPPDHFGPDTPLGRDREGEWLTRAQLADQALIVCFWASWCPHCRAELPLLERIQQALSPEQLRVLLVNTEPWSDWRTLRRRMEGEFKSQLTHDTDRRTRQAFGAPNSVPYTVVVRRDGRSMATLSGWSSDNTQWLLQQVDRALQTPTG